LGHRGENSCIFTTMTQTLIEKNYNRCCLRAIVLASYEGYTSSLFPPLFLPPVLTTMMTISPGDTRPASPNANTNPAAPPDSPPPNSTILALLDLAATQHTAAIRSHSPPLPKVLASNVQQVP